MRIYKLGDQISINLAPNEAISQGMHLIVTFYNEDNRKTFKYSTEDSTVSKITDLLYNVTVSPTKCMEMGLGEYRLEVGIYNTSHQYISISTNDVRFVIAESATGREILG